MEISDLQIGAAGVLLVRYELLKQGIESAPMTTDTGIDLVVYAPNRKEAMTVQVKANHRPKPAGGKGRLQLNYWLRKTSPAQLVALVHLDTDDAWLFTHDEFVSHAQQTTQPKMQFYMYTDADYRPRRHLSHTNAFDAFRIERRITELFLA